MSTCHLRFRVKTGIYNHIQRSYFSLVIVNIGQFMYVCVCVYNYAQKCVRKTRLTSMLTGSMVLIWTLGAEEERSRWPNWLRWSSSPGRKLGMGMDLDGDTLAWHKDLGGGATDEVIREQCGGGECTQCD